MPRNFWKTTEVLVIKDKGQTMSAVELAALLPGRSAKAIKSFAWENGFLIGSQRKDGWRDDEVDTMRAMAGTHTAAQIGAALGRSGRGVQSKAHDLGLSLKQYGAFHHMGTIPNEKRAAYWAMIDGGMRKKHAAIAAGVNPSTAQQWVRPPKEQM